MKIEKNDRNGYTITRDDGTVIQLTANEVSLIVDRNRIDSLVSAIAYVVDQLDGDRIDTSVFEGGRDGFIDDISMSLCDDVECTGTIPDDDEIEEKILDEARWYDGMLIGEEE